VFTAPGAAAPVLAAARASGLDLIETAGATAACIMAAVTGELDDAPGAAIVSLAAGVTAIADGAAHATRDRAAVLVVSDAAGDARLLEPVTKASLVLDAASVSHWMAHAALLATASPRGAVHLALSPSIATAPTVPVATSCRRPPLPAASSDALDDVGRVLGGATRPVLVTGLGVDADDAKWVRALAETLPAPVLATPKGKGALPDPHPLALGLLTTGQPVLARADLVVALGVDSVEIPPGVWPSSEPTVHVGRGAASDEAYTPALSVIAEIGLVIEELAPRLRARAAADWDVAELDRFKRALTAPALTGSGLARRRVVELAREATPAGTLAALDVPLAYAWQSVAPRELLIPNGVATLGFALPAAVAAALARPERRVVAVGGAEGFAAMGAELGTAARLGTPIIAIALNHDGATAWAAAARAVGVAPVTCADEGAFRAAFAGAWAARGPVAIDAHVRR
jgi:acetolactate synthase-1/2/3 large subunit